MISKFFLIDVRDVEGKSPLDRALDPDSLYNKEGCVDIANFLINLDSGSHKATRPKLLCGASRWGRLDLVKELVEQYKIDPRGEPISSLCV